jgi:hypothetical protein
LALNQLHEVKTRFIILKLPFRLIQATKNNHDIK